MQSVVGFSAIPAIEFITLNDLDWVFRVKFCLSAVVVVVVVVIIIIKMV